MLINFGGTQFSVLWDTIFALLKCASDAKDLGIISDYSMSEVNVIIDATSKIILRKNSLDILSSVIFPL